MPERKIYLTGCDVSIDTIINTDGMSADQLLDLLNTVRPGYCSCGLYEHKDYSDPDLYISKNGIEVIKVEDVEVLDSWKKRPQYTIEDVEQNKGICGHCGAINNPPYADEFVCQTCYHHNEVKD